MSEEFERDVAGVEDGDSPEFQDESTSSTADAADAGQPTQDSNLDNNPNFRKFKSEMQRQVAQERKQREAENLRWQQLFAEQERKLREREMSQMDDYERERYLREQAEQQLQFVMSERERERVMGENRKIAERISRLTGAPVDELLAQPSFEDALEYADLYRQESAERKAEEQARAALERQRARQDKQQRNAVDTGSGGGTVNDWQRQYETHRQQKNAYGLFNHALSNTTQE